VPHLIPLSIVIASIVVPMVLARSRQPKRAMTILYVTMALMALVWCMLCLRVYPRYVWPE
jgi:hypothetical protein